MEKGIKSLKWLYPVLFLLFVAWTAVGAFPLVNYEGDSNAVLGNLTTLLAGGEFSPESYYAYDDQPLTYWLIAAVDRITPLGPEESYCLICWLAMVWLAWLTVSIVHCLTGLSRCVILLAWWLMPESYACGMYANSAVAATAVAMAGIWLLTRRRYVLGATVLCIAPLLRMDIMCIYPVVFPLFCFLGMNWRRSLGVAALMAVAVAAVATVGLWLMGGNILNNFGTYTFWNGLIEPVDRVKAIIGCYSIPGMLIIVAGLVMLFRRKEWLLAAVLLLPVVTEHLVYIKMGCAGKHFLYALPFAAAMASYAVAGIAEGVRRRRPAQMAIAVVVFLFETCYVVVPVWKTNLYEELLPQDEKRVPRLRLFSFRIAGYEAQAGIGGGLWFGTADEIMLMSGNAVYPFAIHNLKAQFKDQEDEMLRFLEGKTDYVAVTVIYESYNRFIIALYNRGWRISSEQTELAKVPGIWPVNYTMQIMDMTDGKGHVITVMQWGTITPHTPVGEPVKTEDNKITVFLNGLRSDGRPVYYIMPGYTAFVWDKYHENLEVEHFLIPRAPAVWKLPDSLFNSLDDGR